VCYAFSSVFVLVEDTCCWKHSSLSTYEAQYRHTFMIHKDLMKGKSWTFLLEQKCESLNHWCETCGSQANFVNTNWLHGAQSWEVNRHSAS
jgi:hypothetical protein